MTERYPDDATLLGLEADAVTGVPYIETGQSPYYLAFRRLQYHLLRVAERANDLRVYADGDLSIGVRAGRAFIASNTVTVAAESGLGVSPNATTDVYLDTSGQVILSTTGLPTDRTSFLPLAQIVTDSAAIQSLTDRRAEALLQIPDLAMLGVDASVNEINQALSGINSSVDASALNHLTAGAQQDANYYHRHTVITQDVAGLAQFQLANDSTDGSANMALALGVPAHFLYFSELLVNTNTGFLQQRFNTTTYDLIGTVHREYNHGGQLTSSTTGALIGAVPISGAISDVILSVGANLESTNSDDALTGTVRANGTSVTSTAPRLTAGAGSGFRCSDQGDGTAATVKTDGSEQVQRGDQLTLDLTRQVSGTVSNEWQDVTVLVVIRPNRPE
jgi:hypothetical protein